MCWREILKKKILNIIMLKEKTLRILFLAIAFEGFLYIILKKIISIEFITIDIALVPVIMVSTFFYYLSFVITLLADYYRNVKL